MILKLVEKMEELTQILALQKENLPENTSPKIQQEEGFVTVKHSLELLQKMNDRAPQVIAVENNKVVGYALVMMKEFSTLIPVLTPMFNMFASIPYRKKMLSEYRYYVMGQICVKEGYRGKGVFPELYRKHKEVYGQRFQMCITEVSTRNKRSMNAHARVGFQVVHTFRDNTDEWNILVWDWA